MFVDKKKNMNCPPCCPPNPHQVELIATHRDRRGVQNGTAETKAGLHAPRWEHTVGWTHNRERKQISWPELACREGGAAHTREKRNPSPSPTPNDFKLFCWMTDFISDRSGREKGVGGRERGLYSGGRLRAVATGENTVRANVTPDSSDSYHKTTFSVDKRRSELLKWARPSRDCIVATYYSVCLTTDCSLIPGGGWGDLWTHVGTTWGPNPFSDTVALQATGERKKEKKRN